MSKIFTWGRNDYGQLGDNTTTNKHVPTKIGTSNWTAIAGGFSHSLGISGNKLFAWGLNYYDH